MTDNQAKQDQTKKNNTVPIAFESECAILGAIINDKNNLDYILGYELTDDDFGDSKNKQIWESIKEINAKGLAIDKNTLTDELNARKILNVSGGTDYIDKLITYKDSTNIESYVSNIKDASLRRSIMKTTQEAFKKAQDMENPIKNVVESAEHNVLTISESIGDGKNLLSSNSSKMTDYIDELFDEELIQFRSNFIKTGFDHLDKILDDALYPGIYTIGAISSLGKTTLMSQIADQIAETGNPVLYFSIEQSKFELLCKSLSRRVFKATKGHQITSLRIRKYWKPNMPPSNADSELGTDGPMLIKDLNDAYKWYKDTISHNMYVFGNNFNCTLDSIKGNIKRFCTLNEKRPVVFVDYLQIVQMSPEFKGTDKQKIDICMNELEKLAKELQITIFVVSALNRASYKTPITFESFRESSSIEYSSDVIFALQLNAINQITNADDKINNDNLLQEAKNEIPRKIELKILKNRYGRSGRSTYFRYYPMVDFFGNEEKLEENKKGANLDGRQKENPTNKQR